MPSSNRSCPSHSIFTTGHSLTQQRLQAMHGASNVGGLSVSRQTSNVANSVCLVWNIYITSTSHTYKMIHDGVTTTANTTHGQIIHQSDNNLVALSLSARASRAANLNGRWQQLSILQTDRTCTGLSIYQTIISHCCGSYFIPPTQCYSS